MTKKESISELSSSRVGQNLLLRDVISPKNNDDGNNNTTEDADVDVDDNNPFAEIKTNDTNANNNSNNKKKKDDNTVVNEATKLFEFKNEPIEDEEDEDEKYPFGTSKLKKKTILLNDIPREPLKQHRPIHKPILYMFHLLQGLLRCYYSSSIVLVLTRLVHKTDGSK
jgi:hypothetical protein